MTSFLEQFRFLAPDWRDLLEILVVAAVILWNTRYLQFAAEDLGAFLNGYDLGELLSYKGIAEGVENSNFLVHTSRGYYILTLYEKRVALQDLPFFLGLMEHLAARGLSCPLPVKNRANFGDWLNVSWDDKAAVAVIAAEPFADIDHEVRHGFRILRADLARGRRLRGGKAAIVAGAGEQGFLAAMERCERGLGLPNGVASRRNPLLNASIYWCRRQMADTRAFIGGVQSEGPFDHWIGDLDYAMYVNFYSLDDDFAKKPMVDGVLPMWMLVYHGIVLANPFTGTLNYPVKAPHKRLKLIEFGGRPLFVWYANFHTGKGGDWMGKEDLRCGTDEELRAGVAAIRRAYVEYEQLSDLQFAFMDDHRMLAPDVACTTYSTGTRVVVNYGATPFAFEGRAVPPGDWCRFDR